jgi:recombination DNA repair RAD52 pathway protein
MYRRVAQYYHPDKNAHPDSNNLFKDLKDAYEKNKKGAFIKIAKNPDEYLRHKELTKERV